MLQTITNILLSQEVVVEVQQAEVVEAVIEIQQLENLLEEVEVLKLY